MQLLQTLLENEEIQNMISENEQAILEATSIFNQYPQKIKDYVLEHLDEFIVPGDLKSTHVKIVAFTESAVMNLLEELSLSIAGE